MPAIVWKKQTKLNNAKSATTPVSRCDGDLLLVHFGFCDVAGTDHGLQCQPHAELESQCEGCHLIRIVELRCAVLELFKGFLLPLRQRLHEVIFDARY